MQWWSLWGVALVLYHNRMETIDINIRSCLAGVPVRVPSTVSGWSTRCSLIAPMPPL